LIRFGRGQERFPVHAAAPDKHSTEFDAVIDPENGMKSVDYALGLQQCRDLTAQLRVLG
jgi:hypothetical protein